MKMAADTKELGISRVQETIASPLCRKHHVRTYTNRSEESVTSFSNASRASDEFTDGTKDETQISKGGLFRGSPEERYACLVIWSVYSRM